MFNFDSHYARYSNGLPRFCRRVVMFHQQVKEVAHMPSIGKRGSIEYLSDLKIKKREKPEGFPLIWLGSINL